MIICTSLSPTHSNALNQAYALNSWKQYGECFSLNTKKEIEILQPLYEGITFIETSRTVEKLIGKPLVSINAFFDFALEKDSDLLLINSDIILNSLPELRDDGITILSRYDYTDNFDESKMFPHGFDVFYIPKQFLHIFPPSVYALGMAYHDYSTTMRAIMANVPLYYPEGKYAFHKLHETQYSNEEWTFIGNIFAAEFKIRQNHIGEIGKVATGTLNKIKIHLNATVHKEGGGIDIFYKTYAKDFKLIYYSLASLKKNITGYNKVVVLVPEAEKDLFRPDVLPDRTEIFYIKEYGDKYLFQQVCKLNAHKYCHSEFILYADSDCIFDRKLNLLEFVKDGKPEILYTSWDKVGDGIIWREPTESVMGESVEWETMRRNCMIYHRSTLVNLNKWQPKLESIVMSSERFSEFNLIGSYAMKFERQKYNFVNTDNWKYEPAKAEQLWSFFDKDGSEVHQQEYKRALDTINKALELNLTEL